MTKLWPQAMYQLGVVPKERSERFEAALREIVRREARSEYSSIYAAPGEFARVAKDALK